MIVIEDYTLQHAKVSEEQLRMEIAALLYERETCSLRKAARIVGVDWMKLQGFLGERGIYTYTEDMFLQDLETIKSFKR
jgi:predicted HTH domain antitoxin